MIELDKSVVCGENGMVGGDDRRDRSMMRSLRTASAEPTPSHRLYSEPEGGEISIADAEEESRTASRAYQELRP